MEPSSFDEIKAWLTGFEDCVNSQNYPRVRELFSEMARYYGIHVAYTNQIDAIIDDEFKKEWPFITDFKWGSDNRVVFEAENPYLGAIFLNWKAIGYTANGDKFNRFGRATLLFIKAGGSPIRCYHCHFTLNPGVPFRTYGLDLVDIDSESPQ